MKDKRQNLTGAEVPDLTSGLTVAQPKKRKVRWPKYNQDLRSYRGIPKELHNRVKKVAKQHKVPPGEVMRRFAEYGLQALEEGELSIEPIPVEDKFTIYPDN